MGQPHFIIFANEKGGTGKSTTAVHTAIALAASRWNEFAGDPDAVLRMRAWLVEVRRRAVERKAHARVEAIDRARAWFDACAGTG